LFQNDKGGQRKEETNQQLVCKKLNYEEPKEVKNEFLLKKKYQLHSCHYNSWDKKSIGDSQRTSKSANRATKKTISISIKKKWVGQSE
jgi:hypothetical protein